MNGVMYYMQYKSQGSSSRGIQSGGVILNVGDLCDEEYMRKLCRGSYTLMYQINRSELKPISSMRLNEFEAIFGAELGSFEFLNHLLGFGDIPAVFRKEITDKYGPDADKPKPKTTSAYAPGNIIKGVDNIDYVYVGEMTIAVFEGGKLKTTEGGHMYIPSDQLTRQYGSLAQSSALNSQEIVANFCASYIGNLSRLSRYFLKTKRKALQVNSSLIFALNTSWLCQNEGNNVLTVKIKPSYLYKYERAVRVEMRYKFKTN